MTDQVGAGWELRTGHPLRPMLVIIGVAHQFQHEELRRDRWSQQRVQLKELVSVVLRDHQPVRVCEEAKFGVESIASRLCREHGAMYENIEMPPEERLARAIRPIVIINIPDEEPMTSPEETAANIRQREAWMTTGVQVIIDDASSKTSLAVVCGAEHMDAFERFRGQFRDCRRYDLTD